MDKHTATLKLFNGIITNSKSKYLSFNQSVLSKTIPNGYILDNSISPNFIPLINDVLGFSPEKANASFHKSWAIIKNSSMFDLYMQQIAHYITTYGFETMGIFDHMYVYIPHETLEIPAITENIPLLFVRALSPDEVLEKIILLSSVALSKETLECIMSIIVSEEYKFEDFSEIKNRELFTQICNHYGRYPSDPVEFLRFLVYRLTNESLLIKNGKLIDKIKQSDYQILDDAIEQAPSNLASIFLRYKPLFLAMKHVSHNKAFFNRLRKLANVQHIPLGEDYLNSITNQIYHHTINWDIFSKRLNNYGVFRKIRLLYALNFRLSNSSSIVYKIRNGKGWATEFDKYFDENEVNKAISLLVKSIAKDISENVAGKTFFIPYNVYYAIPSTEKQFVGNIPSNSYIEVENSLLFGVHWTNKGDKRVDLDLSIMSLNEKYGWDSYYRSENGNILFSGDLTDAPRPNGASELFYIENASDPKIINLNYFNWHGEEDYIEYKFFVGSGNKSDIRENYMFDMNKMVGVFPNKTNEKQNTIGLAMAVNGKNRVYFSNMSVGKGITSVNDENTAHTREYMMKYCQSGWDLKSLLIASGANVVHELPEDGNYKDLSPHALDKNTILDLFL
jgi:hypothetical protein